MVSSLYYLKCRASYVQPPCKCFKSFTCSILPEIFLMRIQKSKYTFILEVKPFEILLTCPVKKDNTLKWTSPAFNSIHLSKSNSFSGHTSLLHYSFHVQPRLDHKLLLYLIKGDLTLQKVKGLILWSIILRYEFNRKIEEEKQPRSWY